MKFADLTFIAGGVLAWLTLLTLIFSLLKHDPHLAWISSGILALGSWLVFISQVLTGNHIYAIFFGFSALFSTYLWWKGRNNRKRGKALTRLGAKSRAIIDSMVERLTPSPIPSPVQG
jgi:hypothetical protein